MDYCSECLQQCDPVQRDFGIGSYEYWGSRGVQHNWQWVSHCCDGDLLTEKELENVE